jgi:hypothetical protein
MMLEGRGTFHLVEARNPDTVCCESALLACGLLTVGVPEHPAFPFQIFEEEIDGKPVRLWRWVFADRSADGLYETGKLIAWWKDEAWLAANRNHEWAIVRAVLKNMGEVAWRIRINVARIVIRRGLTAAFIPANASPAKRQHAIDQLEGRIPIGTPFVESSDSDHSTLNSQLSTSPQ